MADEKNTQQPTGSDATPQAGSPTNNDPIQSNTGPSVNLGSGDGQPGTGQPTGQQQTDEGNKGIPAQAPQSKEELVSKSELEKLQSELQNAQTLIGSQGEELGDYREYVDKVTPILSKIQENPEAQSLIQAILDGKLTGEVAKAALENRITIEAAADVTKAHEEVKKELGKTEYDKTKPEDIEKLVSDKVESMRGEIEAGVQKSIKDSDSHRTFVSKTDQFIKDTPDFEEYLEEIDKWLDKHEDVDDIEIAYDAVKGKALAAELKKKADEEAGEAQKGVAANAAGGQGQQTGVITDKNVIDDLMPAGSASPNTFDVPGANL